MRRWQRSITGKEAVRLTGEENAQETELTLSRKFTKQPDNTYIVDGTAYPILAARLKMLNSGEVETKLFTPFNPTDGTLTSPTSILAQAQPTSAPSTIINSVGANGGSWKNISMNNLAQGLNVFSIQGALDVDASGGTGTILPVRSPTKYKWAACTTTAATDLWTPAAGKKFRVMCGTIQCAGGLAAAGLETIDLQEETLGTFGLKFGTWVPIAAAAAGTPQIYFDLRPNGYLATTADKKLQVVLGAAMTAGAVEVTVWGTEE
jgi:hypothetical protein